MEKEEFDNYKFNIKTMVKIKGFEIFHYLSEVDFYKKRIRTFGSKMWIGYLGIEEIKNN